MSIPKRLQEFLEKNKVPYTHCRHRLAYTAQEVAAAQHVPGHEMAKTVILKAGDRFLMFVLPATLRVDMEALEKKLPFEKIEFATEQEFAGLFKDSEVGAMSPFGNLYQLPVYVDRSLTKDEDIVFTAGTHIETIRMKYADFERLVRPEVIDAAIGAHA